MRISLHSVTYSGFFYKGRALKLEEAIARVKKFGYDGIEIMAKRPHANPMDLDKKKRKELKEIANSYQVRIAILAAYNDFSGPDLLKREMNLLYLSEVIKLAYDLEVDRVRVFAAGMKRVDSRLSYWNHWKLCRDGLKEMARFADDYGVTLGLQNHPPVIETYRDVIAMINEVNEDNLKAVIDPELLIWTNDIDPLAPDVGRRLREIYREVQSYLIHVHVGDLIIRQGELVWSPDESMAMFGTMRLERVPLGEGLFGRIAKDFIEALKEIGYNGFISYEICSPRYIKHELVTLETIDEEVKRGAKYLRGLIST